jgi:hypothetical protein
MDGIESTHPTIAKLVRTSCASGKQGKKKAHCLPDNRCNALYLMPVRY